MAHRWDYEHPTCLWEQWPWWLRWPAAVVMILYFGAALIVPFFW